jgi:hypothetical protein
MRFPFQEIMLLKMTSLVKREITDKEKRQHQINTGLLTGWVLSILVRKRLDGGSIGWHQALILSLR